MYMLLYTLYRICTHAWCVIYHGFVWYAHKLDFWEKHIKRETDSLYYIRQNSKLYKKLFLVNSKEFNVECDEIKI